MIRTLLVGAALGLIGKKLYENGTLDPYLARAKKAFEEAQNANGDPKPAAPETSPA